jgi:hypothetical protein
MDRGRLQAITRGLGSLGTRRAIVRGGLAAIGLGVLGESLADEAAARKRARRKRPGSGAGSGGGVGASNCTVCDDLDDCPFTSIQAAINAAQEPGETIVICKGTYEEDITISKNVSLVADQGEDVELEGTGAGSVVIVPRGVTATIQGLVISKGVGTPEQQGEPSGGAILNFGELTVRDAVLQDNKARFGGAIFNVTNAKLTLDNTIVQANEAAGFGGAIYNRFSGEVTISNSKIVSNEANNAGAIYNNGALHITEGTQIANNQVEFDGGGLLNDLGLIVIDDSVVAGNKAKDTGGGILNFNGELTIQNNSEIGGNEADEGGGVFNQSPARMTVIDSAITNNEADDLGGGIFNGGGRVTLQSSTVFRNVAGDTGGGIFNTQGGVITLDSQSAVVRNKPNNCVGTNACRA